jgi:Spy/CpxP family protein refolding chaperone
VLATALGCAGGSASAPAPLTRATPTVEADDDVAAALVEHHRHHQHGGVTLFIAMSLDTLGVSPAQQAGIDGIRDALHERTKGARAAEQTLMMVLADGVASGAIDTAKVDAAVAALTAAAGTVPEASADALNQLHALLTPEQRVALVDKVEAHWAVWRSANADESAPQAAKAGRLAALAADLGLTDDQVRTVRASLADTSKPAPALDHAEVTARICAFGDAFRSSTFDARSVTTAREATPHMVAWGAASRARFIEAVNPVLTADQRAQLAAILRDHASHDAGLAQRAGAHT